MIKFFSLFASFVFVSQAYATDNTEVFDDINTKTNEKSQVITYTIEKDIKTLPNCDDANLVLKTKEFISKYYSKNFDNSVVTRRKAHFVLKNLDKFEKENVANYKTEKKRPISDVIATVKHNDRVIEENIRLCKNQSQNKYAKELYLVVYPYNEGFKVIILNLDEKNKNSDEIYFEYK